MNINLTLIGQLLTFVVFVWFTMKYVWTPIMGALEERRKAIADGLAAGERGQHEQELAKQRAKEVLKDAKGQASDILAQAQKRAAEIIDEAKGNARLEGDRMLAAAKAEIDTFNDYDPTPGQRLEWTGNTRSIDVGVVSRYESVPDGGLTLALLAVSLVGIARLRKRN